MSEGENMKNAYFWLILLGLLIATLAVMPTNSKEAGELLRIAAMMLLGAALIIIPTFHFDVEINMKGVLQETPE